MSALKVNIKIRITICGNSRSGNVFNNPTIKSIPPCGYTIACRINGYKDSWVATRNWMSQRGTTSYWLDGRPAQGRESPSVKGGPRIYVVESKGEVSLSEVQCMHRLQSVLNDETSLRAIVFRWFREFRNGHNSSSAEHTGRPLSTDTLDKSVRVRKMIKDDGLRVSNVFEKGFRKKHKSCGKFKSFVKVHTKAVWRRAAATAARALRYSIRAFVELCLGRLVKM
ncbi:hypothetical protein EVAR_37771_1 [Eumeta japonica]|uniref:Mos1 transposase HTH domain-containing protein n=1 Tax=Eumeta variegata TaxID=151549 RepID=A0A4C1WMY3_EUMVA|nr:hypothetical protein EVAR_37771_1 [Eumeta japonica]